MRRGQDESRGSVKGAAERTRSDGAADGGGFLSRRKLLLGLGVVGSSGFLSGLGSESYLSDQESFSANEFTGFVSTELDLKIAWREFENGELMATMGDCDGESRRAFVDAHSPAVTLAGVERGDEGRVMTCLRLFNTPGTVWMRLITDGFLENDLLDSEEAAGDETPESGELQEHVDLLVWHDENCDDVYQESTECEIASGTLVEVADGDLGSGLLLDGCVESGTFASARTYCLGFEWRLPDDAPSTVSTDSVTFGLEFVAQQPQPDPSNPWEPA